jgi:hypothetical protein
MPCPHSTCRPIECRQKAVAGELDLQTANPAQLRADGGVVTVEQCSPSLVPELSRTRRRSDDIGEHHGRKEALATRVPCLMRCLDELAGRIAVSLVA